MGLYNPTDPASWPNQQHVLWDDQGPYWAAQNGGKSRISPVTAASESDPKLHEWGLSHGAESGANGGFQQEGVGGFWSDPLANIIGGGVLGLATAGAGTALLGGGGATTAGAGTGTAATSASAPTLASTGSGMSILDTINKISNLVTPLSDVLGGAAKSGQQQNNVADQLKLALYNAKQNATLGAKRFALAAPGKRMGTSMQALLSKYDTPTKVNWGGPGSGLRGEVPTYSGGLSGAVRSASSDPSYQKLRDQVTQDELTSQMAGGASGGNQDVSVGTPPDVGSSSAGDNILGGGALTASILAALGKFKQPQPQVAKMPMSLDDATGEA